MKHTPISPGSLSAPPSVAAYMSGANVYDSSCSERAVVWYSDNGYYIKRAPGGDLRLEAAMTRHMHGFGFAASMACYETAEAYDYMVTEALDGNDCTTDSLLAQPVRLAEALARHLRALHATATVGCPRPARMDEMLALTETCYTNGVYSQNMLEYIGIPDRRVAYERLRALAPLAAQDTLIHGDYCLPNVLLNDDYGLSGFIDWDYGGVGDHNFDLFWGAWSLGHNLGTYAYTDVFLDAYGRERVDDDRMLLSGLIAALT